ncbi:hypothetical protein Tco_0495860 [Tanacetum coccineum]
MVEKCIVEIQGTFLVKIRNDAFNGNDGENAYEHINKFLKIVGPIKINGSTQDRFRLSIFTVSLAGTAYEWFTKECIGSITTWDNMLEKFILKFHHLSDHNEEETEEDDNPNKTNNVPKIFRIKGNLFDFETPLCEAYHEFNCLLKIDTDMFTYGIQNFKTYDEYKRELNDEKAKGTEKPWWYDKLADGKLKDETLSLKAKIEGSWGGATPGVVKFCKWLKSCFENFHKLEYEVLVKLQECRWKVNAPEIAPFTHMENFRMGPYANIKTEWANNPYLDIKRTFGRRFEMMKYSFNDDEWYITIKESEHLKHSKDRLDAYRELLRLINEG